MPHTSRKKKPTHNKRQVADLEAGWQRIEVRTPGKYIGPLRYTSTVPRVDPTLTLIKLKEEYDRLRKRWLESECRNNVREILVRQMRLYGWPIEEAVCLAIGSMSRDWQHRTTSMWQLILFLDIVDIVESHRSDDSSIKMFAQEPRFADLDVEFLKTFDITTLETPQAEQHVGCKSFLFAAYLEWLIETPYVLAAKTAPLYIASSLHWKIEEAERVKTTRTIENREKEELEASPELLQDCLAIVDGAHAILQSHDENTFPACDLTDSFTFSIYTRRDESED